MEDVQLFESPMYINATAMNIYKLDRYVTEMY